IAPMRRCERPGEPLRVALFAYPDVQALDLSGPLEMFARATRLLRDEGRTHPGYSLAVIGTRAGPITASSGFRFLPDTTFGALRGSIDTLLVLGGRGVEALLDDQAVLGWLRRSAGRVYLRRPGDQSQYSAPLRLQAAQTPSVRELVAWAAEHLAADLSVPALARRVGKSARHLTRVFRKELGVAPAEAIEQLRLEAARRALQQSAAGLEEVASHCGFGSAEILRRAFLRALHVTPSAYRA